MKREPLRAISTVATLAVSFACAAAFFIKPAPQTLAELKGQPELVDKYTKSCLDIDNMTLERIRNAPISGNQDLKITISYTKSELDNCVNQLFKQHAENEYSISQHDNNGLLLAGGLFLFLGGRNLVEYYNENRGNKPELKI